MPADRNEVNADSAENTDSPDSADSPEGAENTAAADNADLKARMRQALESKQANDRVSDGSRREKGKAPETHGPMGGVHMHRRKAGGGGS